MTEHSAPAEKRAKIPRKKAARSMGTRDALDVEVGDEGDAHRSLYLTSRLWPDYFNAPPRRFLSASSGFAAAGFEVGFEVGAG